MCFFAWTHANGGGATEGRRAVGGGTSRSPYDRWGLPPSRSLAHMSWVGVDGCRCLSRGYVAMTRQRSVWCFIRAFDVEPTWDQWRRSLGEPLPRINDVAGVGGALGGALVGPAGVGWKVQVGWHNSHNHQKHFRQDKVVYKVVFISWSYHTCQRGYL
jgi:hypothetical protein